MPSPFPGVDPYLEETEWQSFHAKLAAEIARQLGPKLRPKYVALTQRRMVPDFSDELVIAVPTGHETVYPDVAVSQIGGASSRTREGTFLAAAVPVMLRTRVPERVPTFFVELRDVAGHRLVTAIELLSPSNKRPPGRRQYLRRRNRVLRSSAHLLEIDLLRRGRRVPMEEALPPAPYYVLLSRAEARPVTEVWPVALAEALPAVPVPLLPGDPDVTLDLQQAVTAVYDVVGYDLLLDYSKPPSVPLTPEEQAWAAKHLSAIPDA